MWASLSAGLPSCHLHSLWPKIANCVFSYILFSCPTFSIYNNWKNNTVSVIFFFLFLFSTFSISLSFILFNVYSWLSFFFLCLYFFVLKRLKRRRRKRRKRRRRRRRKRKFLSEYVVQVFVHSGSQYYSLERESVVLGVYNNKNVFFSFTLTLLMNDLWKKPTQESLPSI